MRSLLSGLRNLLRWLLGRGRSSPEQSRQGSIVAFRLLQNERVWAELGLSVDQIGEVLKFTRQARQVRRRQFLALQGKERQKVAAGTARLQRETAVEVLDALDRGAVLGPEQKDRLWQITWQQQGAAAFAHPLVQEALKIMPAQKEMLRDLQEKAGVRLRALHERPPAGEGPRETVSALRQETLDKFLALLDDGQKARWDQLRGKPFEIDLDGSGAQGPDEPPS